MIPLEQVLLFFPPMVRDNPAHRKYLVKEYIQLQMMDYLATTKYVKKLAFIGGTNLRLIKGIDRFSEDLDFDCKELTLEEFTSMTDSVLLYLQRLGYAVETKDETGKKLKAFRRNYLFPGLLHDLNLSEHRDERFLIKIECQDQQLAYAPVMVNIKGCGYFFPFPVPPDRVLCAMKIAAMLSRQKGRDFYDVMFLMSQTTPDWDFLAARCGIRNGSELKAAIAELLPAVDLSHKSRDFGHLLFEKRNSTRILQFKEFVESLEHRA